MEYTVVVIRTPDERWHAVVSEVPIFVAEGSSKDEVVASIKEQLTHTDFEIIKIEIPDPPGIEYPGTT